MEQTEEFDIAITTTRGEAFTYSQCCKLAFLIWKRFGCDMEASAAAWRRLLQNSATVEDFRALVEDAKGSVLTQILQ